MIMGSRDGSAAQVCARLIVAPSIGVVARSSAGATGVSSLDRAERRALPWKRCQQSMQR
jgi:hypothetical protein